MSRILIMRFSAMGDVAMTVPVITSFALEYPQLEITILSRDIFKPLFAQMPPNVTFMGIHFNGEYKGLGGLNSLFNELSAMKFDYVADFHDVLRTKYLRLRFKMQGVKVQKIDKGRKGKKLLTRRSDKKRVMQPSSFCRYADVIQRLGFSLSLNFKSIYGESHGNIDAIESVVGKKTVGESWIGIAPFAKHKGKIYPAELMEIVVAHFANRPNTKVFLFGGGNHEKKIIDGWVDKYPTLYSMIGKLKLNSELALISNIDVMLSMDSANMHLASIVNTPVVSIWGATHPYAGFMGWQQPLTNAVQIDLECRPCSIYGNKACYRNDYACLWNIKPDSVISKIESVLV